MYDWATYEQFLQNLVLHFLILVLWCVIVWYRLWLRNILDYLIIDLQRRQGSLKVKLWIYQEWRFILLLTLVCVLFDIETFAILHYFLVCQRIWVNMSKLFIKFFYSSKFGPSRQSTIHEDNVSFSVLVQKFKEIFLFYTITVGELSARRRLVLLWRFQTQQNLVVAKKVSRMQSEKFILIFDCARKHYFSLKNHIQLRKVVTAFNDTLVGTEDATIELWDELSDEFIACLEPIPIDLMLKEVVEIVVDEASEQTVDYLVAECGLELK